MKIGNIRVGNFGLSLIDHEAVEFFNDRWSPDMGAIDGFDLRFIEALISEAKPKTVVEVGCASGLSTAMMAMMLNHVGPAKIHSYDLRPNFYADPTKKTGYLVEDMPRIKNVEIEINTGRACMVLKERHKPQSIDFCFIDANHKNPWPAIDTLAVLPLMKPGAYIVHHDLQMFRGGKTRYATGPKLLWELLPSDVRVAFDSHVDEAQAGNLKTREFSNNIFAIKVPEDINPLAERLSEAFSMGWDLVISGKKIQPPFAAAYLNYLARQYSSSVAQCFEVGLARLEAHETGQLV